jgi:hypothetical protein
MWTPGIVLARFTEAAHTERFLPTALMPTGGGYWPSFIHDEDDRKGWDDAARLDNAEKWKGRASNGSISRHAECLDWTSTRINDEKRRHIVWNWAFCRANGWSFGARCVKKGWARPTAYRRLTASIEVICDGLNNEGVFLRLPHEKWLRQEEPNCPMNSGMVSNVDAPKNQTIKPGYRTDPHHDLIQTEADVETFAKFLERRNARLRKIQEWRNEGAA